MIASVVSISVAGLKRRATEAGDGTVVLSLMKILATAGYLKRTHSRIPQSFIFIQIICELLMQSSSTEYT